MPTLSLYTTAKLSQVIYIADLIVTDSFYAHKLNTTTELSKSIHITSLIAGRTHQPGVRTVTSISDMI
jgi:hypothetical protein